MQVLNDTAILQAGDIVFWEGNTTRKYVIAANGHAYGVGFDDTLSPSALETYHECADGFTVWRNAWSLNHA